MITSMKNAFSVEGLNVLITGGNQGIGKGIASAFAELGANVAIMCRNAEKGEATVAELREKFGANAKYYQADLTKKGDPKRVIDAFVEEFGSLNVLVNNAGATRWFDSIDADENDFRDWYEVIELDFNVPFVMAVYAAKKMRDNGGGSIINITSNAGEIVNTPMHTASYSAAKAGVNHLTRMLAHEWAKYGIRVNAIAPGFTRSNITPKMPAEEYAKLNDYWMEGTPTGRRGDPLEIAAVAVYLASESSEQTTGTVITVDGGYSLAN